MNKPEASHPFYRPLWRRIAIIAVIAAWFVFELVMGGNGMWLVLAGAMLGYAVWTFLINWPKTPDGPKA